MLCSSTESIRNFILKVVADFAKVLTRTCLGTGLGLSDLDARGLAGKSGLLSWPLVSGCSIESISISSLGIGSSGSDATETALSRPLLRAGDVASTSASDDGFRFRSRRDPSIGSSGAMSWLKTEWESGLIVPRCDGNRSPGTLSLDIFGDSDPTLSSGISGTIASGIKLFVTHSGQIQCSASKVNTLLVVTS